jgi:hypothetical protein
MDNIRTGMPLLARHEGEWVGEYIHVDANNVEFDRHASHLQCKFQDDATYPYYQINTYTRQPIRTNRFGGIPSAFLAGLGKLTIRP